MDAYKAVVPSDLATSSRRVYFTPSEANRALVLVRRIVAEVVRDYEQLCELHEMCCSLDANADPGRAEDIRQRYATISDHLAGLNEELEKVGCDLKDYRLGLVDFPAMKNGREVCLCWQFGEEAVECWHDIDSGYSDRRPIGDWPL